MSKKNKFKVINNDGTILISLNNKTNFVNEFNGHKYLNNKNNRTVSVLHKKRNWKEISQACLDNIELPEGSTNLHEVDYTDLVFNFITKSGDLYSIPLVDDHLDDLDEIIDKSFNPSWIRTNYPHSLVGNHFNDFLTTVIYQLYRDVGSINNMIQEASIIEPLTINDNDYNFTLTSVEHNKLVLDVTCNETDADTTDFTIVEDGICIDETPLTLNVSYSEYTVDNNGVIQVESEQTQTVTSIQLKDNNIILGFEDNTFKLSQSGKIVNITLKDEEDQEYNINHILYYNILPRSVNYSSNFIVNVSRVVADNGDDVELIANITSRDGRAISGNVDFYLE